MVRRSTAEYYLKFLVVHPDGYPNGQIKEICKDLQLDFIGEPYLERLRASCIPPIPFYPSDKNHRKSQRFLQKEQLQTIFLQDEHMQAANKLLATPQDKEIVETLLITGSSNSWISAIIRKKGFRTSPAAIQAFKHYYYNVDLVDSLELKALTHHRAEGSSTSDPDEQALTISLMKANYTDPRRSAAYSPISPLAGIKTMMRMGILPSNTELARLASAARVAATIGVLESSLNGDAEKGRDFSIIAANMTTMLEAVETPDKDLKEGLASMTLRTDSRAIPHIDQLGLGGHTVEMAPDEQREPDFSPMPDDIEGEDE